SRGALVRKLTAEDVKNMLGVLSCLEDMAGRLTCAQATDGEIAAVRSLHDKMVEFYEARNRLEYFKINQQIHSSLVALSGNDSLVLVHDMLQKRMKRIRFLGNQSPGSWEAALADHEEMIAALEARDGDRLSKTMTDHLAATWERIQDTL
ncbi:MAG: GntR family transcriptional regulator, partial [Propionivibrio sp.]